MRGRRLEKTGGVFAAWFQTFNATRLLMTSIGFFHRSTARGRSFSSRCTCLIARVETWSNSVTGTTRKHAAK
jgi:hypothetical protein